MSNMLLRAVHAVQPVYYGHIVNIHKCTDYQGIQVSLQVHAKAHFGTMIKCVDFAGVLIFKYPD